MFNKHHLVLAQRHDTSAWTTLGRLVSGASCPHLADNFGWLVPAVKHVKTTRLKTMHCQSPKKKGKITGKPSRLMQISWYNDVNDVASCLLKRLGQLHFFIVESSPLVISRFAIENDPFPKVLILLRKTSSSPCHPQVLHQSSWFFPWFTWYHMVNVYITMENHHVR